MINIKWKKLVDNEKLSTVASVICSDEDKILVLLRSETDSFAPLHWDLPGGHVDDSDASIEAGAIRELAEEAGLIANLDDLRYVTKKRFNNTNKYFFIISEWDGAVKLIKNPKTGILEHIEYKWLTISEIKELEKSIIPAYLLKKGLEFLDDKF